MSHEAGSERRTSTLGHGCPSGDQNGALDSEGSGELWKILGEGGPWSSFPATLNQAPTKAGLSPQSTMVSLEHSHVCLRQTEAQREAGALAHPSPLPRGRCWLLAGKAGVAWVWLGQCGLRGCFCVEAEGRAPWSQPGCGGAGAEPSEGQIL